MNRLLSFCAISVVGWRAVLAQDLSTLRADSVDNEIRFGQIVETEDSPLAELLDAEPVAPPVIELRSRFIERAEATDGYRNGTYRGSRLKSYQRIRFTPSRQLSGGMLMEKDPGERRINDFMTGFAALRDVGPFRMLLLGDYVVESGLGLSLWRGAEVGKGEDVTGAVVRKERGIVPHLSSDENAFFRGAALGLQLGSWSVNLFSSHRHADATLNESGEATGIYAAGYFRTAGEESKRSVLGERLSGATAHYQDAQGNAFGACLYRSVYSRTLKFDRGERFLGGSVTVASCDYTWNAGPWILFGEWGVAHQLPGGNSGVRLRASHGVEVVAALRWYPYRFVSLHGNGFGERRGMSNEKGLYAGLRVVTARHVSVVGYADFFRFPEGTPTQHFASGGSDRFLQIEIRPVDRCAISMRYVTRSLLEDAPVPDAYGLVADVPRSSSRRSVRLNVEYRTVAGVKIRGRWEKTINAADFSGGAGHGMLVLTELTGPSGSRFWWNVRAVVFHATSYDARVYSYERDLEGVTTMPALYGEGLRWSCVLRYTFDRTLACSVKYSQEIRDDVKRIGSGPDRLPGNEDARAGIQFDLSL